MQDNEVLLCLHPRGEAIVIPFTRQGKSSGKTWPQVLGIKPQQKCQALFEHTVQTLV